MSPTAMSPSTMSPSSTSVTPQEIGLDGFIAEVVLEAWQRRGRARRVGGVLWLDGERAHDVVDAVRIVGRRNGESDLYGWTGRVFPLRELLRLGAALGPDGAKLGSATYDVEFGVQVDVQPTAEGERPTGPPGRPITGPTRPITGFRTRS